MARILIADDSVFMRMLLKKILTAAGHQIIAEAGNGKDAVTLFKLHKPDIVTMDITMPEMDGIEAVKHIHEEDCLARIVMVTAIGQEQIVKSALLEGASDFIIKPFEEERVVEVVSKVLNR